MNQLRVNGKTVRRNKRIYDRHIESSITRNVYRPVHWTWEMSSLWVHLWMFTNDLICILKNIEMWWWWVNASGVCILQNYLIIITMMMMSTTKWNEDEMEKMNEWFHFFVVDSIQMNKMRHRCIMKYERKKSEESERILNI